MHLHLNKNNQPLSTDLQLGSNLILLKQLVFTNLYNDINNEKIKQILKEKINTENIQLIPNDFSQKLLNFFLAMSMKTRKESYNKKFGSYFKKWHKLAYSNESTLINYKIKDVSNLLTQGKIRLVMKYIKIRLGECFSTVKEKIYLNILSKGESDKVFNSLYLFENIYNHNLLHSIRAFFKIFSVIKKKNLFLTYKISLNPQIKNATSLCNYFSIWKYKSIRISKEVNRDESTYKGLLQLHNFFIKNTNQHKNYMFNINKKNNLLAGFEFSKVTNMISLLKFLTQNSIIRDKLAFFHILKSELYRELKIKEIQKDKAGKYFVKAMNKIGLFIYAKKHFNHFSQVVKMKVKCQGLFQLKSKFTDFVKFLSIKLVRNQLSLFFSLGKKCINYSKTLMGTQTKKIDSMVIKNTTTITLYLHQVIEKKTRLLKYSKLLHSLYKMYLKKTSLNDKRAKYSYFNEWRNQILMSKEILLSELKNYQELHVSYILL
jgi:hypothetical protein